MKLGPLTIWQRMHSNGTQVDSVNVISWHWSWSLTWRWGLTKAPYYPRPGTQGFSFTRTYYGRGFNFILCYNSRLTGHWSLKTQPNMAKRTFRS